MPPRMRRRLSFAPKTFRPCCLCQSARSGECSKPDSCPRTRNLGGSFCLPDPTLKRGAARQPPDPKNKRPARTAIQRGPESLCLCTLLWASRPIPSTHNRACSALQTLAGTIRTRIRCSTPARFPQLCAILMHGCCSAAPARMAACCSTRAMAGRQTSRVLSRHTAAIAACAVR